MLQPECTNKCGRRTDTGVMCRRCLKDLKEQIIEINSVATKYIVLKASSKKLAEELLVWWYS